MGSPSSRGALVAKLWLRAMPCASYGLGSCRVLARCSFCSASQQQHAWWFREESFFPPECCDARSYVFHDATAIAHALSPTRLLLLQLEEIYRTVRLTKKLPVVVEKLGKRLFEGDDLQWLVCRLWTVWSALRLRVLVGQHYS